MMIKMVSLFAWWIILLLCKSYRFEVLNPEVIRTNKKDGIIFALWHRDILSFTLHHNLPIATMLSQSKDGEFLSRILKHAGYKIARGSSSRGGGKALRKLVTFLRQGYTGVLTVDGPRGPIYIPKKGILLLSKITKRKIVPFSCHPKRAWVFNSWDKFRLPKPFTKIYVYYGTPWEIPENSSNEDWEKLAHSLTNRLHHGEQSASHG